MDNRTDAEKNCGYLLMSNGITHHYNLRCPLRIVAHCSRVSGGEGHSRVWLRSHIHHLLLLLALPLVWWRLLLLLHIN